VPKDQIRVMSSAELFSDPYKVMSQWSHWLGLSDFDWKTADLTLKLSSRQKQITKRWMSDKEETELDAFYAPYNEELFTLLNYRFPGWYYIIDSIFSIFAWFWFV
jgi:hypothetical protein